MSNTDGLEKVDWSFEGNSKARELNKMRGARRTVSSIITNSIAVRAKRESFLVYISQVVFVFFDPI